MTPADIATKYREFLSKNLDSPDFPANSKLVVHSTFDYFMANMDHTNCLRASIEGLGVMKSEW